jgi:hypothetical protein
MCTQHVNVIHVQTVYKTKSPTTVLSVTNNIPKNIVMFVNNVQLTIKKILADTM